MKQNQIKKQTHSLFSHIFFSSVFFLGFFLSLLFGSMPKSVSASEKAPALQKITDNLTVGKSIKLSVKNLPENSFVFFFSSDSKTASVHRNTGKLFAKKKGTVTISAQIYQQNKKIKTIKTKLNIQSKDYIENAQFSLKKTINPYDYTIMLKSSRIILKKEIMKSRLTITPEGKKAPKLSASFSELSKDGKDIVYLLNPSSRKKLCPHDNSMNGNYIIKSNSFKKKLKANYEERLDTEDISGFVMDIEGTPLSNTFISYETTDGTASSYTDETGHYEIKKTGTPVSLSAEKEGYHSETLTSLLLSKKGTICENFILKSEKNSNLTMDFFIKDETGTPVPDAQIYLFKEGAKTTENSQSSPKDALLSEISSFSLKDALISETTGEDGTLLFTNSENSQDESSPYTKITATDTASFSLLSSHIPLCSKKTILPETIHHNEKYVLFILKNTKTASPSYEPCRLSFSPSFFYTGNLYFEITLKKNKLLDASKLTINFESPEYSEKISTFSFSFYEAGQKKPIFDMNGTPISMFSSPEFPVSFSDGTYYLKISALDKNGEILYFSPITEIKIKNSQILPVKINLRKKTYSRLLAYFSGENFSGHSENRVSFELYQKTGNNYFYLTTVSSSDFKQTISDLYTADFSLSCLLPSHTYLFLPENKPLRPSTFFTTEISADHLYPTEAFALMSPPFSKCSCIFQTAASESADIPVPDDFFSDNIRIYSQKELEISKEQIRTEPSYLNSVIALYKKDGTFISTTLSAKLDKNTVFSKKTDMIIDIYTNHELLLTNQSSYQ